MSFKLKLELLSAVIVNGVDNGNCNGVTAMEAIRLIILSNI